VTGSLSASAGVGGSGAYAITGFPRSNQQSGSAGVAWSASTAGLVPTAVSFSMAVPTTQSKFWSLQYRSTVGGTFVEAAALTVATPDVLAAYTVPLPTAAATALTNAPGAGWRLVTVYATGNNNYATAGTGATYSQTATVVVDAVVVSGYRQSPTPTTTPTRSTSGTPTLTRSGTASPSNTGSGTPTASLPPSATSSASGTASPSVSPAASASVTPSPSASLSGGVSPSASPSTTGSPSLTGTGTPSPSATPSATGTPPGTPSPAPTGSPTSTTSPTPSVSPVVTLAAWNFDARTAYASAGVGAATTTAAVASVGGVALSYALLAGTNYQLNAVGFAAATAGNGTTGVAWCLSTDGYTPTAVTFALTASTQSSRYRALQLVTYDGAPAQVVALVTSVTTGAEVFTLPLGTAVAADSMLNNNPGLCFQLVNVFAPGTAAYSPNTNNNGQSYSPAAAVRLDNVAVFGRPTEPSSATPTPTVTSSGSRTPSLTA
jgi:hypothetical protein